MSVPPAVAERARSLSCSLTPVRGGTVTSTSSCVEAVLSYSRARGPERLLLATMAAVADEHGEVREPLDRGAVRRGRDRGQDVPARTRRAACVGPARAGQRRRWSRQHERVERPGPARDRRRAHNPGTAACGAACRRAAAGGLGRFTARAGTGGGGHKGRSRSDTYRREVSCPDRGFRAKGRSGSDSFAREVSCPDRGFGGKGRSGSDTFRFETAAKPRQKPRRKPRQKPRQPTRAREGNP